MHNQTPKMRRSRTKWGAIIGIGALLVIALTGYLIYLEYHSGKKFPALQDPSADSYKSWTVVYVSDKKCWAIYVGQSKSVRTKNGEYTEPMALYAGKEKKPSDLYDDWIKYDTTVKNYGGTLISEAMTFTDSLKAVNWLVQFKTRFPHGKRIRPVRPATRL